jgi:hypothetical protein
VIPDHLRMTTDLLSRAFPLGIRESEYSELLEVLYPCMADENLALVIAHSTGRDLGSVLNDVLGAGARVASTAPRAVDLYSRLVELDSMRGCPRVSAGQQKVPSLRPEMAHLEPSRAERTDASLRL